MIFIQSENNDVSTNDVLDWVYYLSAADEVKRINNDAVIDKISIRINKKDEIRIGVSGNEINVSDIDRKWYRRGAFKFKQTPIDTEEEQEQVLMISARFQSHLDREMDYILKSVDSRIFDNGNAINKFEDNRTNKIDNLIAASEAGLLIPDTLITNEIHEAISFAESHQKVITKAIAYNDFSLAFDNIQLSAVCITTVVDPEKLKQLRYGSGTSLLPALFQQYVEKKYELRIFYLKGRFYAMAIFSQASEATKLDFRNNVEGKPNRCVPYKLPREIEQKIDAVMRQINMNCGSIDMIVTPENEYVFLEVNPVGQFQWVSWHCNYDIERQIANYILRK